ncbi:MAG: (d)CMP kinase [Gemmatimonadaceae bacterium]|nr:(d)CMP kinase [Gemmatimonadaceae bacterium]
MRQPFAITIDGPAASGKTSTAFQVAEALGFHHVDSGALYRAATAAALRAQPGGGWDENAVLAAAEIVVMQARKASFTPLLGGKEAEDEIRGDTVTAQVSVVAKMPRVRDWVNAQVRSLADLHDVVVDGRDIGTIVLPNAGVKVFLLADGHERARRRLLQRLGRQGTTAEVEEEMGRLAKRDALDAVQTVPAPDATIMDTTDMSQAEQVRQIIDLARSAGAAS